VSDDKTVMVPASTFPDGPVLSHTALTVFGLLSPPFLLSSFLLSSFAFRASFASFIFFLVFLFIFHHYFLSQLAFASIFQC